ncbi:hypothetical protein NBO_13g0019 [Nosema bombycis CQ1]|uniref:Uncharacterized protein n=1 Tax=Nosema bombycis (strain CQ1 / CVCC 102059) TaxID=578461 RepID=R0KXA9_NOSB1|nr:hypothetical protein NBO_13g0019 [Nosema bombycis CQ1]|eukprot:EOB14842.1 hypothetical protein NBO_13g0019 [Nosema bombycis CQ1]
MSDFVFNSNLLKFLCLSYVLSVILFTNNALCSKRKIEVNPSLNHGEPLEKISKSINEKDSGLLEIKCILQSIYTNEDFIIFKNLIGEAFTNSYQVYKDLIRYESFHDEFLSELYTLILQSFPESGDYYNSDIFYNEINNLLNYFANLLNEKKRFENESGDYIKPILDLYPYFEKINELMPVIKLLFDENIFDEFYDELSSLGFTIKKMKKIYDLYVHWMIGNTTIYSYVNEILEDAKKQNDFLISETTLPNLGDEVSNHRRNLKENICKLFIDYHNCVKDISKCLSGFVNSLCTFTIYSESCMSDCNAMEKILKNN